MNAAELLWLPVALPLGVGLACLLLPARAAGWVSSLALLPMLALAGATAAVVATDGPLRHAIGGWAPPLGIALHADGLAAAMLALAALVCATAFLYAECYFPAHGQAREGRHFRPLAWLLWGGLDALLLSDDLFNLYVTLEVLSLAAAGLTALAASPAALAASLRYLMAALAGSTAFLLGVALVYGAAGTLALPEIPARIPPDGTPAFVAALIAMTAGLALKAALFPLHGWLPPAHGDAPTPVSALLSALVVKAAAYVLLRLWVGPLAGVSAGLGPVLGWLGAAAILWGSALALLQTQLKRVVAYSTVAQLGYLFIAFPLLAGAAAPQAFAGIVMQALAHGLAKAALFLAAGSLLLASGRDDVAGMRGMGEVQPLAVFAFATAGASLAGLPLSGGFAAKWLLLQAAWTVGAWHWLAVMLAGSLLTAAYVLRVLQVALLPPSATAAPAAMPAACPQLAGLALLLALLALAMGLATVPLLALVDVGMPPHGVAP